MTRDSTRNSLTSFGEWSSGPPGEIGWIVGHTSIESTSALAPDLPTTTESAGALVLDFLTTESAGALVFDLPTTESAGALVLDLPTTESAGALTDVIDFLFFILLF
ncbi:unnamed protein product [Rhizophagus irregularis]|uniref:Uncharacterized protein n=1 Tax=Rhizophagus irregularis TaxID=588596 RepID=A0A915Z4F7_9GLOM|nr:unnamed protein product [Rhizophagus irregularis]